MRTSPARRPGEAGFTLFEILIAALASALLVAALADGIGLVTEQVEQIRIEGDDGPDEVVALMSDMSRYGWNVETPAANRLDIVDVTGARTSFALADGELSVTRPAGASGALLSGVDSLSIQTESTRRLREEAPLDAYRPWWEKVAANAPSEGLTLENGLPVALGFTMASGVPDDYDTVADVDEHALQAALQVLEISMSYVSAIPDDPNEPVAGDGTNNNGNGNGNGNGNKVQICHVPPGNPANAHTLSVNQNAVDAHLAHGDSLGSCSPPPPPPPSAQLVFSLYEARAPDDARPHGPALATGSLVATGVPAGNAQWVLTQTGEHGSEHGHSPEECSSSTPDGKVVMCHVPPGNPSNAHSITISPNAVSAHLAHGDYYGCCGQHSATSEVWTLQVDATPGPVAIDLSALGAVIEPGRAYTLVMELQSEGFLVIGAEDVASSDHSGVAQSAQVDGDVVPLAKAVPFTLKGIQRITQTSEHTPISSVSLALTMDDGREARAAATVLNQVAVSETWAGTVSGETGALQP